MGSRSALRASACLIQLVLCGFFVCALDGPLAVAQSAGNPQELLKQAAFFHQAGKFEQAIEDYRLVLEQYPDLPQVRSDLGAALAAAGRYQEAIAEYRLALRQKALPQVELNLGLAYYKTYQLRLAIKSFNKAREEMPKDSRPVLLLADCYLRLGENKNVIELLEPLERQKSEDAVPDAITYMMGTAMVRDGQADKGQLLVDKILRNGDSAEARLLLGTTKLAVNDFSGALVDLQRAVELKADLPGLYSYYGVALLSTGDQVGAQSAFEHALKDDPNDFDANLRMGLLLRKDEQYDNAMRYLRHALEARPGDPGVRYQIASVKLALGRVDQARSELESLVAESPNFTEAHVSLATAYYREKRKVDGDRERAIVERLNTERQAKEKGAQVTP
jgi:tetratricopeptide (TPR) repeat protein